VRVVVRTHEKELLLLRSLIYSLRAEREGSSWLDLDFVLVPTEPGAQETYRALREGGWLGVRIGGSTNRSAPSVHQSVVGGWVNWYDRFDWRPSSFSPTHAELNADFDDIQLLDVPDSFYAEAKAENPYNCTEKERVHFMQDYGPADTHALCDQDHYMYFKATDRALAEFVVPCATCTHVLVTNGDNGYAPDFFAAATQPREDVVITHVRKPFPKPRIELTMIDLGAVLLRKRVFEEGRRLFLTSLPKGARARAVHGADFWFVKHAVGRGMSYRILNNRILMYHH